MWIIQIGKGLNWWQLKYLWKVGPKNDDKISESAESGWQIEIQESWLLINGLSIVYDIEEITEKIAVLQLWWNWMTQLTRGEESN